MDTVPENDTKARLFIGLWPDDAIRRSIWLQSEQWAWPRGARRVRPEKLHMTLHFLGAVPRSGLDSLMRGLDVPFSAFAVTLDRCEMWPGGIAVLAPAQVPPALAALHLELQRVLDALDIAPAREGLRAHVTLARRAKGAQRPFDPPAIAWDVDGFALIESVPGQGYVPLKFYPAASCAV